jgi:ABC-type branched-subunit amino acid transport system substrate-binding protein
MVKICRRFRGRLKTDLGILTGICVWLFVSLACCAEPPLTVVVIHGMTGNAAQYGAWTVRGAELAQEEANQAGWRAACCGCRWKIPPDTIRQGSIGLSEAARRQVELG